MTSEPKKYWWLAVNGPSVAASPVPLPVNGFGVTPVPEQLFGFATKDEQAEAQVRMVSGTPQDLRRYFRRELAPKVKAGKVAYFRPGKPQPAPKPGDPIGWYVESPPFRLSQDERNYLAYLMALKDQMEQADVILGKHQKGGAIFYGRDRIEEAAKAGKDFEGNVLTLQYDSSTHQLEAIIAAVRIAKGRCDYESSEPTAHDGQHRHKLPNWLPKKAR
jgi:hypothetical protein